MIAMMVIAALEDVTLIAELAIEKGLELISLSSVDCSACQGLGDFLHNRSGHENARHQLVRYMIYRLLISILDRIFMHEIQVSNTSLREIKIFIFETFF